MMAAQKDIKLAVVEESTSNAGKKKQKVKTTAMDRLSSINDTVAALSQQSNAHNTAIRSMEGKLTELGANIERLNTAVEKLDVRLQHSAFPSFGTQGNYPSGFPQYQFAGGFALQGPPSTPAAQFHWQCSCGNGNDPRLHQCPRCYALRK
jgi:hypothetical protein